MMEWNIEREVFPVQSQDDYSSAPFRSQWQPIEVDVVGYRLVDTIETAAFEAIHIFCNQHPMEVAGHPIGLFPAIDSSDPE
jgi:hypothetical protein